MQSFHFEPVGVIHSPYKEKFGIPRQPGLAPAAISCLELLPPYNREETVRGLEGFSHLWISFIFHGVEAGKWKPMVRPPRLGGNQRIGVFASRSTHRPNPLGLSVVELERIEVNAGVNLFLRGADLLDGTPVVDIKPYIPYADSIPGARAGFAPEAPTPCNVEFSPEAETDLHRQESRYPQLRQLIIQILQQDPRPAYRQNDQRGYAMKLYDFDLQWQMDGDVVRVMALRAASIDDA